MAIMTAATATLPSVNEGIRDPLAQVWVPRLLSHDLALTTAWLYWGLPGVVPLFVLGLAGACAAVAMWAAGRTVASARRVSTAGMALLTAIVVGFGTPVNIASLFNADQASALRRIDMAIVDGGITPELDGGPTRKLAPWAGIENRGRELNGTTVVFSLHTPSGAQIWSAWYSDVAWPAATRKRLAVEWAAENVPPGEYRVGVTVTDADQSTTYARLDDLGYIRVPEMTT